jgi:hypothetical protein
MTAVGLAVPAIPYASAYYTAKPRAAKPGAKASDAAVTGGLVGFFGTIGGLMAGAGAQYLIDPRDKLRHSGSAGRGLNYIEWGTISLLVLAPFAGAMLGARAGAAKQPAGFIPKPDDSKPVPPVKRPTTPKEPQLQPIPQN